MKSDREFLDGIYIKAEKLADEQNNFFLEKKNQYKKWAPLLVAAIVAVVLIPGYILMLGSNVQESSLPTPMSADVPIETRGITESVGEVKIFGEITAIVPGEDLTYLLVNVTELKEGFAPETLLLQCENKILKELDIMAVVGGTGLFVLEEQLPDEFLKQYNNRIKLETNEAEVDVIEHAIEASETGNGFIGYFKVKEIGEYHGI